MPLELQVGRGSNLQELEHLNARLGEAGTDGIKIWLASDTGRLFFQETRIAALIASAAQKGELTIVDSVASADPETRAKRFETTPDGLASVVYASQLVDTTDTSLEWTDGLVDRVIDRGGLAEAKPADVAKGAPTAALTVCAFDDKQPIPLVFSDVNSSEAFVRKFRELRKNHFEVGASSSYSERIDPEADRQVAIFAFEAYQNGYRHGRRKAGFGTISPGLRYVRMRRYIGRNRAELIERADGFPELQEYLSTIGSERGQLVLMEVSVSDHGIGIVDRFVYTRPEYRPYTASVDGRISLVNKIITERLSSSRTTLGAGKGLRNALTAVDQLKGFVSIRSANLWLYRSAMRAGGEGASRWLEPVSGSGSMQPSAGTQLTMLLPTSVI